MSYPAHTAIYVTSNGRTERAVLRIREDITDKRADALRQLRGNRMDVAEITDVIIGRHDS